jgi:hypothetical protein
MGVRLEGGAMRPAMTLAGLVVASSITSARLVLAAPPIVGDRLNDTAYTLRQGEVSFGLLSEQVGVFDEVTVGTYLLPWFVFPFLKSPIPTAFVKVRDWMFGPVAFSVHGAFAYFDASSLSSDLGGHQSISSALAVFPLNATASVQLTDGFTQSLEVIDTILTAGGRAPSSATIAGTLAVSTVTVGALSELRLTRVFALTLLARMAVFRGSSHFVVDVDSAGVDVHADLGAPGAVSASTWCLVPGVSFHWPRVGLELGLGYGTNWIPFIDLPVGDPTIVPEADFFVRF